MPTRLRTVRRRGEADRVEAAALDRLADSARRRGRADGPVGGDVVDLPAALLEPGGERLGRDVGAGQQHPVDRVEARRRTAGSRPAGPRWTARPLGTSSGWMPKARTASAVDSPTQATLTPANARASRPSSANFSRTALHRVHRGEDDPAVPAGDQALDGAVHLRRGCAAARRRWSAPRPGRRRTRAAGRSSRRPGPWCAAPAPASRTAGGSPTRTAGRACRRRRRRSTTTGPVTARAPAVFSATATSLATTLFCAVPEPPRGDRRPACCPDRPPSTQPGGGVAASSSASPCSTSVPPAAAAAASAAKSTALRRSAVDRGARRGPRRRRRARRSASATPGHHVERAPRCGRRRAPP